MGAQRRVAVIVVTYNSAAVLGDCLRSLPAGCDGVTWDLLVVDNASTDDSIDVARSMGATVVATGANKGYAAGVNAGVASCRDDVGAFLVLNPDVRLEPGALLALLAALDRDGAGITVPRVLDGGGRLSFTLRREPTVARALGEAVLGGERAGRISALGEVVTAPHCYDEDRWVDWASGAVMLISRRCYDAVGPWDESFFLYSEETDFCLRARAGGHGTRYVAAAGATHLGGESGTSAALWSLLTVNRVRCFSRRHGRVRTGAFHGVVLVNELVRAPRSVTHRAAVARLVRPRRPFSAEWLGSSQSPRQPDVLA